MKGCIVINAFLRPKESVFQAERLQREFLKKGVETQIITDGFLRSYLVGDRIVADVFDMDFCVFLDKDKYLSESLEKSGVRLFNRHRAIRVCDDKARTYIALSGSGVNLPDTVFGFLSYSEEDVIPDEFADGIIEKLSLPVVLKECYGSMGKGVYLAKDKAELLSLMERVKQKPHLYQRYVGYKKGVDVRIIVIGGKVKAVMERVNDKDFRSNVGQGGVGKKAVVGSDYIDAAEKCARILELDYCGVDLLCGENGPVVCEVNSNAFFAEAESVTGVNIAAEYVEYIIKTINANV